jgi:diacylglycerol kinase family enzyme
VRALLVFNPNATTTDDRVRDVIAAALGSETELEVAPTKQRGHATLLAAGAVHEGLDAVFSLGGDGTANEVLQALAGTDVAMGVIPGGGANVFARALGLPNDPIAATSIALEHLRAGRHRRVSLGRAGDRYFGFNAGYGFDAAVVRMVEQHAGLKRRLRQLAFVALATRAWFTDDAVHAPSIQLELDDGSWAGPFGIAMIGNADPYTYLGERPMRVTPRASFDAGLDLMTIDRVRTPTLLRIVTQVFSGGTHVERRRHVHHWHDLPGFSLSAPHPLPLMVDGDYAGEHRSVHLTAVPRALAVLA